jgi:hypothetical protein
LERGKEKEGKEEIRYSIIKIRIIKREEKKNGAKPPASPSSFALPLKIHILVPES